MRFELEVRHADGMATQRTWTRAELESLKTVCWPKRVSAKGHGVFIRLAVDHGLVLVDDLKADAVDRKKHSGIAPAVTLETRPGVYQAWIKIADQPLSAEGRAVAAQWLATQLGGVAIADGRPCGQLARFTNWQLEQVGRPPYVFFA